MRLNVVGVVTLFGWLSSVSAAHADVPSDALNAAKAAGLENGQFAIGLDVGAVRHSPAFKELYDGWLQHDSMTRLFRDHTKAECGIDLLQSIEGIVLVGNDSGPGPKGRFFVSTKGLGPDRITECLARIAAKENMSTSARDADGIVEVRSIYGSDFVAVLPKGVIAFSAGSMDRAAWKRMLAPKPSVKSALGDAVAAADTKANFWGVMTGPQRLEGNVMMQSAAGSFTCDRSKCEAKARASVANNEAARQVADKMREDVALASQAADVPPAVLQIAKRVSFTAVGPRLEVHVSMTEAELVKATSFAFSPR